jgi:signal transduction histidine kinase
MRTGVRQRPNPGDDAVRRRLEQGVRLVLHEVRQPLAAIFALAEAARTLPELPAEAHGYLTEIIRQADEVSSAAVSVLDPEGAATPVGAGPVDADEVVDSVIRAFGLTWSGTLVRDGDRGPTPIGGDRATVRRCLVNLVDNAARAAGPAGTVVLSVQRGVTSVRILVEDDGPGFGHGPSGTGLGIEATRRSLAAIGGHLSTGVRSGVGGGSMALHLPAPAAELDFARRPLRGM